MSLLWPAPVAGSAAPAAPAGLGRSGTAITVARLVHSKTAATARPTGAHPPRTGIPSVVKSHVGATADLQDPEWESQREDEKQNGTQLTVLPPGAPSGNFPRSFTRKGGWDWRARGKGRRCRWRGWRVPAAVGTAGKAVQRVESHVWAQSRARFQLEGRVTGGKAAWADARVRLKYPPTRTGLVSGRAGRGLDQIADPGPVPILSRA